MKLRDMKVRTQLRLVLGLILTLVLALGTLAWKQGDALWLQTRTLHDHPLQVRSAIGAIKGNLLAMRLVMDNLLGALNDGTLTSADLTAAIGKLESDKSNIFRQMDILDKCYLGPSTDFTSLDAHLIPWRTSVDETIQLLRAGKPSGALVRFNNEFKRLTDTTLNQLGKVDDFARKKAVQVYNTALEESNALTRQLALVIAAILLISLIASWRLLREIKDPLQQLTAAANRFRKGEVDARSGYVSANEFGGLSNAFNAMADTIQGDLRIKKDASSLSSIMSHETGARAFFRELLQGLMEHTGSMIGAVYILNSRKTDFEHFESIGLSGDGHASFSALTREGEFGAALATDRIQRVTDIPDDTRFSFVAVSGELKPREIVTIPVLSDEGATAMVSLASVHVYTESALRLLDEIWDSLNARVNSVLAFRRIQDYAEQLESQNRELEAQKKELAVQTDELTEINAELEMQKRQLDEANRLKSSFLSNMSHELRTPLNSVIALSNVLGRRLAKTIPKEEYGYLDVIERNGKQLLALINDILDISRIEAGQEKITLGHFSIRTLVSEITDMLEPQSQEKGIALLNQVDEDLPPVTSDTDKCRHILQNLVGNAVKFTETGSVDISARREGNEIRVAVHDTGIGIAADHLPYIFDEFRQVDVSTSRKYSGAGLGLAIARKYATALDGRIIVESSPGLGSTFTLILPLTLSLPAADMDAAMPLDDSGMAIGLSETAAGHDKCILLIEDSEPTVIQMTDILTSQGYRVRVSRNGREALAEIENSLPDAVILDLMMPEVDGFEVLKVIRENEKTAGLPVLILTAKHVTRDELRTLKGNAIHQLIQKGNVSRVELLSAVGRMVAPPMEKPAPSMRPWVRGPRDGKPVILVVEDNADNLQTLRALLSDAYTVLEAFDGRSGVDQARQHQPNIILMDIALPVMDGFAALAEIREDEALSRIPIVAVTASAMKGDRERIIARGFNGYISKPIDEEILRKTLHEVLYGNE